MDTVRRGNLITNIDIVRYGNAIKESVLSTDYFVLEFYSLDVRYHQQMCPDYSVIHSAGQLL